jgi:hypothetical protein
MVIMNRPRPAHHKEQFASFIIKNDLTINRKASFSDVMAGTQVEK